MKKLTLIILTILLVVLGACSTPSADEAGDNVTSEGVFNEADLVFVYQGIEYPLNSDAAPLFEALGQDYVKTTAPSCVYEGEDKMFEYASMTIYTYPMDDKDIIDEIYYYGGDFATAKGIMIGSTLEEIKGQYGEGFDTGSTYEYVLSGSKDDLTSPRLTFELTDDIVSGVSYYSASNVAE